jgi:hypothetical protein
LPDCRAYEQVSPAEKGGVAAYPAHTAPAQVSSSGEAIAYRNLQAFPGAVGNTALAAAHVSVRTGAGWQTAEWTPRVPVVKAVHVYKVDYTFSPDLSQAIIGVPIIPLTPEATPYALNLFHRDATGEYSLVNSKPPTVPVEAMCLPPEEELLGCYESDDRSGFAGASGDFSHVLFESNAQIFENGPATGVEGLYENSGGTVTLVGILPDKTPAATSTAGAGSSMRYTSGFTEADLSVERAVSQDGSHVVFQAPADGGGPGETGQSGLTEVYDRINGAETVELSAPAPGATPTVGTPEEARFQTASVDGSRVFFTSKAELTSSSNTGAANEGEDLYEYNFARPASERLVDLTVDPADATGAEVLGVVDSSTDGSYVYFVAHGQLQPGRGAAGQPNLYMVHNAGSPVFIATLGSEGNCRFIADPCVWSPYPAEREAYVAQDGRHMAFMSSKSLPTVNFPGGYDNIDQETLQADSEVYEYTAPTKPEGAGQLLCASCDLTGARPVGKAVLGGFAPDGGEQNGKPEYSSISTSFYRVRSLSENGQRLFYAAPASVNTPYDSVYEYEHDGEGTCEDTLGCQSLISSPSITEADVFLGSSADGSNVYFATPTQLVTTDTDKLRDVYDARVDGGIPAPPVELPCEASCHSRETTQTIPSPASLVAGPSENLAPPPPPPPVHRCTRKGFRLSHGRCVRVKKKHSKKHKSAKNATAIRKTRGAR